MAFALPTARNDKQAEQQTALLASLSQKLREHGHAESCERLIRQAAQGAEAFQQVSMAVDQLCAGETEPIPTGAVTFEEFSRQWLNGELEKLYPGQLRKPPARLAPVIGRFENYIFPVCGKVPLRASQRRTRKRFCDLFPRAWARCHGDRLRSMSAVSVASRLTSLWAFCLKIPCRKASFRVDPRGRRVSGSTLMKRDSLSPRHRYPCGFACSAVFSRARGYGPKRRARFNGRILI